MNTTKNWHNLKGVMCMQITMKQARVGADMTQADVAEKMGIHPTTYLRMEKHPEDLTIKQARVFSNIVGLKFDDIIFVDESN